MDLTLTVTDAPEDANMINHTKAFRAEGGSLGRADKNTWVLPDNERVVSSTHAKISFDNGRYYLTDTSTNGTFYNDEDQPVGAEKTIALNSGDTLKIGNYKIKVSVKQSQQSLAKGLQSADFLDSGDKTTFTAAVKSEQESLAQVKELDDFLDPTAQARAPEPSFQNWDSVATNAPSFATQNDSTSGLNSTQSQDPLAMLSSESSALNGISNDPLANAQPQANQSQTNSLDPLAQWDQSASTPQSQWQDNDDEWWLEGSQSDNANAKSHAIRRENAATTPAPAAIPNPAASMPLQTPAAELNPTVQAPSPEQPNPATMSGAATVSAASIQHSPEQQTPASTDQTGWGTLEHTGATMSTAAAIAPKQAATQSQMQPQPLQPSEQPQNAAALQQPIARNQPTTQHQPTAQAPQQFHNQPLISPAAPQQHQEPQAYTTAQNVGHSQVSPQPHLGQAPAQQPSNPVATTAPLPPGLAQALGLGDFPEQQLTQLVPEASAIISETVTRLIDLLRARSSIKNELRVQRTMIQATDNNPLKFSASADEALRIMFSPGNQAYLRPNEAVKDSFDDLSDHQVAVLSGMRAAYDAMLKHFNPDKLDRRFKNSNSMLSNKKAKNWEDFQDYYASLLRDGEASYDLLFGEEFASSYEKQLSELKTARSLTTTL
ncbi:MAG: type VI secretion system-associated FHA domain protein TagH [Cellvibrionaceae bacterium]